LKRPCHWFLVCAAATANAACGAIKNDTASTGGSGAGGGAMDDDGAPKPPPARAAVSLHLDRVDPGDPIHGNSDCSPRRHWVNIPYQRDREMESQTQHTSENDAPVFAVSGESGDQLHCRVAPRGTAFEVSAEVPGYAEVDGRKLRPTLTRFSITAISTDQNDAIGRLTIQDDATLSELTDEGCVFSTRGGALGVAPGRIWATVKCEYLEPRSTPGQACRVDAGAFILESCAE
jgi:hypothetical protein